MISGMLTRRGTLLRANFRFICFDKLLLLNAVVIIKLWSFSLLTLALPSPLIKHVRIDTGRILHRIALRIAFRYYFSNLFMNASH